MIYFVANGFYFMIEFVFSKKATKIEKSSQSIWHLLYNGKLMVKSSSIFEAFLENKIFTFGEQDGVNQVTMVFNQIC